MDQGPLVSEQIEAGAWLLPRFQGYAPLSAAFWLKDSHTGNWHLWLASDKITDKNFDLAYEEVIRLTTGMPYPTLNPMQVKVANTDERMVQAALAFRARHPASHPVRVREDYADSAYVEEAYIYPLPATVAA